MLIIFFRSDGEIFQVVTGYRTMQEFYKKRYDEFNLIFDYVYIDEINDYILNRYIDFIVVDKRIKIKNNEGILKVLSL